MLRKNIASALAVVCLAMSAIPAFADNMTVKDSSGTTKTVCTKTVSTVDHPCHLMEGAYSGAPTPIKVLSDGTIAADPAASTAALQTTANTKLDSVISALASPLTVTLSGVSTSAKQDIGNTSLASIDTKVTGLATAAAQATAATKLDQLHTDMIAATPGGTNIIGDVGSASFSATCTTLTLPGTGGTYALGDLAANSATAGSVTPLSCVIARYSGGPVTITKARIQTSTTGVANASFRLHVYTSSPTASNGNDGVFLTTASGHFCRLDVAIDQAFSDGADGSGVPVAGSACTRVLSATQTVYVLVEARAAYAWTAAQTLTINLEGFN